jgi:osmotically-inducible protein OsmY
MDYRGRGPKGYTRSDERIREDVCERLTDDPFIDASDINLTVRDGTVTLEGRVDERWMKHRVEDLVEGLSGVKQVENRLTVSGASADSDAERSRAGAGTGGGGSATKRH